MESLCIIYTHISNIMLLYHAYYYTVHSYRTVQNTIMETAHSTHIFTERTNTHTDTHTHVNTHSKGSGTVIECMYQYDIQLFIIQRIIIQNSLLANGAPSKREIKRLNSLATGQVAIKRCTGLVMGCMVFSYSHSSIHCHV